MGFHGGTAKILPKQLNTRLIFFTGTDRIIFRCRDKKAAKFDRYNDLDESLGKQGLILFAFRQVIMNVIDDFG